MERKSAKPSLASYYSDFDQENNEPANNGADTSMEIDVDPTFESFQQLARSVNVNMSPQIMNHLYTLVQHDVFADDIYMILRKMYDASKR